MARKCEHSLTSQVLRAAVDVPGCRRMAIPLRTNGCSPPSIHSCSKISTRSRALPRKYFGISMSRDEFWERLAASSITSCVQRQMNLEE